MVVRRLGLLAFALVSPLAADLLPELGETQVNSLTDLVQSQPAVAAAPDGRFVVVWQSATSGGDDQSDFSIQAQLYDATGAPDGAQFQVNSYTVSTQWHPDVAMNGDGAFVVAWESYGAPAGGDTAAYGVRMRGFTASGTELFAERQANEHTAGDQIQPTIAWVAGSEVVVAWQSSQTLPPGGDGSGSSIQARRFAANGAPLGSQFTVNDTAEGYQVQPDLSADGAGGFLVVWGGDEDAGGGVLFRLRARPYAAGGVAQTELLIDDALGDYGAPAVAHGDGRFVVAWQSLVGDPAGLAVRARRYTTSGQPLAAAWTVNTLTTGDQEVPAVGVSPSGDFLVLWQSDVSAGGDISSRSVQGQLYDATAVPIGDQLQVNDFEANPQDAPALAVARGFGRLVAAWESTGSGGTDNSLLSVQARSWIDDTLLFADPYETGDLCRWSLATPPAACP